MTSEGNALPASPVAYPLILTWLASSRTGRMGQGRRAISDRWRRDLPGGRPFSTWAPRATAPHADFRGDAADLDRNIRKLLIAAGLSPGQREEFAALFRQRVDDHRPAETRPDYAELPLGQPVSGR